MPTKKERRRRQRKHKQEKEIFEKFIIDEKFIIENATRKVIKNITDMIKDRHCLICGDTEKDGDLILADTQEGKQYFCEFCFNCQMNM